MSPHTQASCQLQFLSKMFFFLVTSTSFALSWAQLTRPIRPAVTESLIKKPFEDIRLDFQDVYRTTLKRALKYMLLWPHNNVAPFDWFGEGQRLFRNKNCSVTECYLTANRSYFGGDLTKFDAIAFNGRGMHGDDLPKTRSRHQQYIYFNMESAENYPVCDQRFDSFFNWTATYRLNSDIPFPYILIREKEGNIVGPKQNMKWKVNITKDDINRAKGKKKAAAWFVSNCHVRSGREAYVYELQKALKWYGLTVDVYGSCGTLSCPRNNASHCNSMLKNDYFFYMAMENTFDKDYVTEKLLRALQNDVVPIVYGGADYSRFLPPGSYIDTTMKRVVDLAPIMKQLMQSPKEYSQYFAWQNHYTYHDPRTVEDVCDICKALHDDKMMQRTKIYDKFRKWWNHNYVSRCGS